MRVREVRTIEVVGERWSGNHIETGCRTKRPWDELDKATAEMHRIMRQDPENAPLLNVYECPICTKFHIGRSRWRVR
jgi:hypothetical protein